MNDYPDIIQSYWYSIDWDVAEIWALDLPVSDCPISDLVWHLDAPVWPGPDGNYTVTPRQVLENPNKHAAEALRIDKADTNFPLDVYRNRGKLMILDGIHRLAKLVRAGATDIDIRVVPDDAVRHLGPTN